MSNKEKYRCYRISNEGVGSISEEVKAILVIIFLPMIIASILIPFYLPVIWLQKNIDKIDREVLYCLKRFGLLMSKRRL
jgi:bacteriorhodopsin